jgi:hypothetical protein
LQKDACGYAKVLEKKENKRKVLKKIDKCPRE